MAKVGLNKRFCDEITKVAPSTRKKINDIYSALLRGGDSNGLNLETVNGNPEMMTVRVNDNFRIVLHRDGKGNFTILHIDQHDKAYAWAARNRLSVNPFTGEVQLYVVDIPEVREETPETGGGLPPSAAASAAPFATKPPDDVLLRLGVPHDQLPIVRSLRNDDDILALEGAFSQGVYDILLRLYDGESADELIKELESESRTNVPADDIAAAVAANAVSQSQFVFLSNEEELDRFRRESLAKWRVFLHPSQRRIVEKRTNGPMKVLGGAGTGKTVVAMHRVKYLLEKVFIRPDERVLFTTFTKNLAEDIRSMMESICDPKDLGRLDVVNLDQWAQDYLRRKQIHVDLLFEGEERTRLMETAMSDSGYAGPLSAGFFIRERSNVVLAGQVSSLPEYLRVSRAGQGTRLSAVQKKEVWKVLEAYRQLLARCRKIDFGEALVLSEKLLRKDGAAPYAAVVVDEAQDFSVPAMRLVAALSGNTLEAPRPDSLLVVGDAHQRIYGRKVVLSACGIQTKGRSAKLRINYRTTEKIRRRAVAMLAGVSVDDLDGGHDDNKGFRSLVPGQLPEETRFADFGKEMDAIAAKLKEWKEIDGRDFGDYAVLCRRNRDCDNVETALRARGFASFRVKRSASAGKNHPEKVRIATMHRVKGLEFAGVVIAEVNQGVWPYRDNEYAELDSVAKRIEDDGERSLLYVAMTRAMTHAFITGIGPAPAELGS